MSPKLMVALAKLATSKAGKELLKKSGTVLSDADINDLSSIIKKGGSDFSNKALRDVIIGSPMDYVIKAGTEAGAGAMSALGDISANNVNRLAAALLKGGRVNNDIQNQLYGYSEQDKANEAYAENKVRQGTNTKIALDTSADVLRNTMDLYNDRNNTARMMEAASMSELPGSFYNLANGVQSRATRATKGRR